MATSLSSSAAPPPPRRHCDSDTKTPLEARAHVLDSYDAKQHVVYCCFAYKEDLDCLRVAVEAIRYLHPKAGIAIFDDAKSPIGAKACPQGVHHYEMTHFDRRGNLNGRESVYGQLLAYLTCATELGADLVIKFDADTLLTNPQRLLDHVEAHRDVALIGASNHQAGVWGSLYIVRSRDLHDLLIAANSTPFSRDNEDQAISEIVARAGHKMAILDWDAEFFNGFGWTESDRDQDPADFLYTGAITFDHKQVDHLPNPRKIAARAMAQVWDRLLFQRRPLDWPAIFGVTMRPSVAVIVIGRNCPYLLNCLESIRRQTVTPDEFLYVDDFSDPSYRSRLSDPGHLVVSVPGLKVILLGENVGMSAARMKGLDQTTSELLLFVDSDNTLPPDYLETLLREIGDADMCYTGKRFIGAGKEYEGMLSRHPSGTWDPPEHDRAQLWVANYVDTCALVRREALLAVGGWRSNPGDTMFDWDMALRISGRGPIVRSSARINYRLHGNNWSKKDRSRSFSQASLYGSVRRHAATLTVATVWSGRIEPPEYPGWFGRWLSAVEKTLEEAKVSNVEMLLFDNSKEGTIYPYLGGNSVFKAFRVINLYSGQTTHERRPSRRLTAEFLSSACNGIVRVAQGDVVWLIEDDIIVPPHACDDLLKELLQSDQAPHPAVAGLYRSRHKEKDWVARRIINGKAIYQDPSLDPLPDKPFPVQLTGTGCLMVLRDLLKGQRFHPEICHGPLREYAHDWHFSHALHHRGTPVRIVPSVICRHHLDADTYV